MFTRRAVLAAAAGVVAGPVTDSWAQPAFPTRPLTVVAHRIVGRSGKGDG